MGIERVVSGIHDGFEKQTEPFLHIDPPGKLTKFLAQLLRHTVTVRALAEKRYGRKLRKKNLKMTPVQRTSSDGSVDIILASTLDHT
ncbi:hypothetical protein A2188_01380 [Candidatus Woesebacteria bacterium RIFOXYA1_FULL_43_9]|uniref:Uncharacterized protein n=1 Tax=Candidatus Woesebacteria bacterium RIFOXYA1_FULL_43_9 TaxID=1802534 RepID=A0A1F8CMT1_9BACT|nr:MAG: hypothetical protein A2188_01380 [Candidatus Woesebacteria bacterium RIFOXYA1_FULL_43_9]